MQTQRGMYSENKFSNLATVSKNLHQNHIYRNFLCYKYENKVILELMDESTRNGIKAKWFRFCNKIYTAENNYSSYSQPIIKIRDGWVEWKYFDNRPYILTCDPFL